MNLRELIIERIYFAVTEDELEEEFRLTEAEVEELSDIDLLELYEEIMGIGLE